MWAVPDIRWQKLKHKLWKDAAGMGSLSFGQLSHFACLGGHFLLVSDDDFIRGWLPWILTHLASKFWKLLAQQEKNLLVLD